MLQKIEQIQQAINAWMNKNQKTEDNTADDLKSGFVNWIGLVGPFMLAALLSISNGYFFSGFQPFTLTNVSVLTSWGAGFAIEGITLAALFNSAIQLRSGNRPAFLWSLAGSIFLMGISFVAQYVYLEMELINGTIKVNDQATKTVPFMSWLIGDQFQGHDALFFIRSISFHVAEFACTYMFGRRKPSTSKQLQTKREEFELSTASKQQDMILAIMSAATNNVLAQMKAIEIEMTAAPKAEIQELQPTPFVPALVQPQGPSSQGNDQQGGRKKKSKGI